MKVTLLLLIVCLTEIYANDPQKMREECYRENGAMKEYDELMSKAPKMTDEEIVKLVTPHKLGCIMLCYLKKQLEGDMSMRKRIDDGLNKPHPDLTDAKIATLRNEVDRCKKDAKDDDCDLMMCLKPWSEDIAKIVGI